MKSLLQGALVMAAVTGMMNADANAKDKVAAKKGAKDAKDTKKADSATIRCYGINTCTGKSECSVEGSHACAGKNDCKGKGWIKVAADKCAGEGSKVLEGEPTHKM